MKYFNPVEREYVAPIDLQVADNALKTLEKGHQDAVKTASDLRIAISNLPMNDAEAGFKQALLNDITTTVRDNTLYGNSYSALDDIITKQGDIFSNQGVLGRIANQKAYLEYQKQIDAADLPEDYKNYYREKNKYYYKDKYDDKGTLLQGELWQPTKRYTKAINAFEVMNKAIANAARKKGGTSYVNDNGVIKTKVGNTWEILDEDTIKTAIESAFANTPGMEASLTQDYEILLDKYRKGEIDGTSSVTDGAGNELSRDMYVQRQIDKFAKFTQYSHNWSDNAYEVHPPSTSTTRSGAAPGTPGGLSIDDLDAARQGLGTVEVGTTDIMINPFDNAMENKKNASKVINETFAALGIKNVRNSGDLMNLARKMDPNANITGPQTALNVILNRVNPNNKSGLSNKQLLNYLGKDKEFALRQAWDTVIKENKNIRTLEKTLGEDKDAYKFMNSVNSGSYNAKNSKYDKKIVNAINNIFASEDNRDTTVNIKMPEDMFNELVNLYGGQLPNAVTYNKIEDDYIIYLNNKDRNLFPELAGNIINANNNTTSWINPANWFTAIGTGGDKRTRYEVDVNNRTSFGSHYRGDPMVWFKNAGKTYNEGKEKGQKVTDKFTSTKGTKGRISQEATNYDTETKALNAQLSKYGKIETTEAKRLDDMATANLDMSLANANLAAGRFYETTGYEKNIKHFTPTDRQFELQGLVSFMYTNHKNEVARNFGKMKGIVDPRNNNLHSAKGYYITFTVPDDYTPIDGAHYKAGDRVSIFVSGTVNENTGYNLTNSTADLGENAMYAQKFSGIDYNVIPFNNHFANSSVKYNNGAYEVKFMGKTAMISGEDADDTIIDYNNALYTLQQAKMTIPPKPKTNNAEAMKDYNESVNLAAYNCVSIAQYLSGMMNIDPNTVLLNIVNYLKDETTE